MTNEFRLNKKEFLQPENMILLYSRGAFPMADEDGEIDWYMPRIRTIIPLDNFNVPRSLTKHLKTANYEYRIDFDTAGVIEFCSQRENTWISDELKKAYKGLIELGNLHSVEVYQENLLVGGLYGITYKGAFFGESMFSKIPQASKAALVFLLRHLHEKGFKLLDIQYLTEHLRMFGAVEISFEEYEDLLIESYQTSTSIV